MLYWTEGEGKMFGLLLGKLRDLLAPVVYAEVLEIKSNYYDKKYQISLLRVV